MLGIAVFHILMLLLGLSIVSGVASPQRVSNTLGYLHKSIGITTPSPQQVRLVALVWMGSIVVIVDGCLFLLVFLAKASTSR
jgi:hypothetical protein